MFLPKLHSMDLYSTLSTIIVFHIPLFLIKELNLQQKKYWSGLMLMKFTDLTMFPTILKHLA